MGAQSRVVIVRLKSGAVLLLAPAIVFPWPRMLERKTRQLHARGVRQALGDVQAMRTLRQECPQLLHAPTARGPASATSCDVVAALEHAALVGLITIISGNPGRESAQDQAGEIQDLLDRPEVGRKADEPSGPTGADPKALPQPTTRVPREALERMDWVVRRTLVHFSPDDKLRFAEFFTPRAIRTTVALLGLWRMSSSRGGGFVVDANLFALGVWRLGSGAVLALDELKVGFDRIGAASSWPELDRSAGALTTGMNRLGPTLFRQMLRRIASKSGSAGEKSVEVDLPPSTPTSSGPFSDAIRV